MQARTSPVPIEAQSSLHVLIEMGHTAGTKYSTVRCHKLTQQEQKGQKQQQEPPESGKAPETGKHQQMWFITNIMEFGRGNLANFRHIWPHGGSNYFDFTV